MISASSGCVVPAMSSLGTCGAPRKGLSVSPEGVGSRWNRCRLPLESGQVSVAGRRFALVASVASMASAVGGAALLLFGAAPFSVVLSVFLLSAGVLSGVLPFRSVHPSLHRLCRDSSGKVGFQDGHNLPPEKDRSFTSDHLSTSTASVVSTVLLAGGLVLLASGTVPASVALSILLFSSGVLSSALPLHLTCLPVIRPQRVDQVSLSGPGRSQAVASGAIDSGNTGSPNIAESAEVNAPESKLAEVNAPESKLAEVNAPESKLAEVNAPESKLAEVNAPESKLAEVNAPESEFAEVNAPESKLDVQKLANALSHNLSEDIRFLLDSLDERCRNDKSMKPYSSYPDLLRLVFNRKEGVIRKSISKMAVSSLRAGLSTSKEDIVRDLAFCIVRYINDFDARMKGYEYSSSRAGTVSYLNSMGSFLKAWACMTAEWERVRLSCPSSAGGDSSLEAERLRYERCVKEELCVRVLEAIDESLSYTARLAIRWGGIRVVRVLLGE